MVHAIIPRSSSNFCNDTASHTKPAAQTIPDLMDLLREWSELLRSWWTKLEKKGSHGSQVCMITALHHSQAVLHHHCNYWHSAHQGRNTKGERNVPNSTGTHKEAKEQTRNELHWTYSRYTSLGPAQAGCYMGTNNSVNPVCTKLLLDHAGEWYRTAKIIQVH